MKTYKIEYCTNLLNVLGRYERTSLLLGSNLDNREFKIIYMRFTEGLTVKEAAYKLDISEKGFEKAQKKALEKLYLWLERVKQGKLIDTKNLPLDKLPEMKMLD